MSVIAASGSRAFGSSIPPEILSKMQKGIMRTDYRGAKFSKCPFDVLLYIQLIERLKPRSVIEIGTKEGGSALWLADTVSAYGYCVPKVIAVDISLERLKVKDERITFIEGDALNLGGVLKAETLATLPRPWLVIEDSAHLFETSTAVLNFFDAHLQPGDYIVVEDGILADIQMVEERFTMFQNRPNRAVAHFLANNEGKYQIDEELCDYYGYNVTYSPNGWLRRL